MDEMTAVRNGPIHQPPLGNPTLAIATGVSEQPAFHDQQRAYVDAWRSWHHPANVIDAPELNHFTIVLELGKPESRLATAPPRPRARLT